MPDVFRPVQVTRVTAGRCVARPDVAVTEEPLEIRLNGESFAVVMRTPGLDTELVAGFLLAERVIQGPEHIGTIRHCEDAEHPDRRNVVAATVVGIDVAARLDERRRVMMNASCGLCGRLTLESLKAEAPLITASWSLEPSIVASMAGRLRAAQSVFEATGGLHAAGLFDHQGRLEWMAEDVGRHNAVDKVIGRRLLLEDFPLEDNALLVSGRASFEIVQKAFLAGIPIVCAVSAPSSLAIELADEAGITLLGFVRGDSFDVYTHGNRVGAAADA